METTEIIKGCKAGNNASQAILYDKYYNYLYSIAKKYYKDRGNIEDMIHEAFVIIFCKITTFKNKGETNGDLSSQLMGWMKSIMVNQFLIEYNKKKECTIVYSEFGEEFTRYREVTDDEYGESDFIGRTDYTKSDILTAMNRLSDDLFEVYTLHMVDGYKRKNAAKELGLTYICFNQRLKKAKNKMNGYLRNREFYMKLDKLTGTY